MRRKSLTPYIRICEKSEFEAYATEVGLVLNSISHMIKHIDKWVRPVQVKTPLQFQPGKKFYCTRSIRGRINYRTL